MKIEEIMITPLIDGNFIWSIINFQVRYYLKKVYIYKPKQFCNTKKI